jgi:hypothetical protein
MLGESARKILGDSKKREHAIRQVETLAGKQNGESLFRAFETHGF